jgi:uncharacterized protein with GYD domain
MALYMYQVAYTAESWAAQLKNPQNRIETVVKPACAAVGGELVGGWYCFGEYDVVLVLALPDDETMSAVAMAVTAGGAFKDAKTTKLMTGAQAVAAMRKSETITKMYRPAR